jgi:rhodanese-related sulfurtransferase
MNWTNITLAGIAAAVGVAAMVFLRQSDSEIIMPEQLQSSIDKGEDFFLLDVRTAREFESGHIPGSINIPLDKISSSLNKIPQQDEKTIIVYCERGPRARSAQKTLIKSGYSNVLHLKGDMSAWRSRKLPVQTVQ